MAGRLDDTPVNEAALDETVADVQLDESLDQVDRGPGASPKRPLESPDGVEFDPEADKFNVRNKQSIRKVVGSDGGQLILGFLAAAVGLAIAIYAAFLQTTPAVVTAGILCPPTLIYAFIRWRLWLGQAPYLYRLLTSLGEDADDLLDAHRRKLIAKGRLPGDEGAD